MCESHCSGLVFKFMKARCPFSWSVFEQDCAVSIVEVREICIFDVYSKIANAAVEDPVDGATEESMGQYALLTDTGCCEKTVT